MVALYEKFHSKGLNIIGVSLDNNAEKWKQAILKDGLKWTQVSNLLEWNDPIAKTYEVNQIPSTFLLDTTGKIVAVDLRGLDLENKISELLVQD